ncbi:MAG: hypothetical protein AAF431_02910 [Pseudomonadota bacterium]
MIRFLMLLIFAALAFIAYAWYSAQSLPDWYQADQSREQQASQALADQIKQQGVGKFLGGKFADVMNGKLVLSEPEFNALFQASLRSSRDGRLLLQVSDAIHTEITDDGIELGVIVSLDKVSKLDARTRKRVEDALEVLPLLEGSRIFLAVKGQPIARDGNLAIDDDFSVRIGAIPFSNALLKQMGVPVERVAKNSLPINLLSIKSVSTSEGEITFGVTPRF